jgi:hypothetical protein
MMVMDGLDVGVLLGIHCEELQEQVTNRRYFYRSATLVADSIISVREPRKFGQSDLSDCTCELDRRMLDWLAGLDTEIDDLVEGSSCYSPSIRWAQVVLPAPTKQLVLDTVANATQLRLVHAHVGLDKTISYGRGLLLLFWGPSGTGE